MSTYINTYVFCMRTASAQYRTCSREYSGGDVHCTHILFCILCLEGYEHKHAIEKTKITTVAGQIRNRGKTHFAIMQIEHFAQSRVAVYLKQCRETFFVQEASIKRWHGSKI